MKKLKVAELFAGVGGFRLGLEKTKSFEVIWSNQWEPSTKKQHASLIYEDRFKTNKKTHSSEDIFEVDISKIPYHDVLVGGFPCQGLLGRNNLKKLQWIDRKKGCPVVVYF